jgi:hypothetical protein
MSKLMQIPHRFGAAAHRFHPHRADKIRSESLTDFFKYDKWVLAYILLWFISTP